MRTLVIVVLAGCYSPAPYASCNVLCKLESDCPTGLSCFANRCSERADQCTTDAAITADALDPKGDEDGDEIPNGMDLCVYTPSKTNHDHDADGRGDPCDPCPFSTNNSDGDGDGIGDVCDPRPSVAGELASAFYGFYDPAEYSTWSSTGTWEVTGGRAVGNNLGFGGATFESPTTFDPNVAIYAGLAINQLNVDTNSDRFGGVSARRSGINVQSCQLRELANVKNVRFRRYDGSTFEAVTTYAGSVIGTHDVALVVAGPNGTCTVDGTSAMRSDASAVAGKVAIEASLAVVEVDYLFVVTSPAATDQATTSP